ncbi:hypothetical protein HUJ04_010032 [Dendroctonus ponderosae]|nr:hypothetical protein HUJ04_010032 [Dendroctonus ponderosae]
MSEHNENEYPSGYVVMNLTRNVHLYTFRRTLQLQTLRTVGTICLRNFELSFMRLTTFPNSTEESVRYQEDEIPNTFPSFFHFNIHEALRLLVNIYGPHMEHSCHLSLSRKVVKPPSLEEIYQAVMMYPV